MYLARLGHSIGSNATTCWPVPVQWFGWTAYMPLVSHFAASDKTVHTPLSLLRGHMTKTLLRTRLNQQQSFNTTIYLIYLTDLQECVVKDTATVKPVN